MSRDGFEHIERYDRYMGAGENYPDARAVIFGIPMDFTTSFRPGTRFGPSRVREVSYGLETFSYHQGRDLEEVAFYDLGEVDVVFGNVSASLERARKTAEKIVQDGKLPFMVGGEHLVTLPVFQAVQAKYSDVALLHFDAHADLREDYLGERHSHASVMRRCCDLIDPKRLYQFGIRSGTREEYQFGRERANLYPGQVLTGLRQALPQVQDRPVYISIDIDVMDPAFAPGTGTPEPGGVTSAEMIQAIKEMGQAGLNVVGYDVVEVAPPLDTTDRTAMLGAKLIREGLLAFAAGSRK